MKQYMLDTNLFNDVLDGKISLLAFRGRRLFVTHVQFDELSETKNVVRADKLKNIIEAIRPDQTPTSSAVWRVSKWNQTYWPDADGLFGRMLALLRELDALSGKTPRNPANQPRDVLIAETALKHALTLVTGDANLRRVMTEFGGRAIELSQIQTEI